MSAITPAIQTFRFRVWSWILVSRNLSLSDTTQLNWLSRCNKALPGLECKWWIPRFPWLKYSYTWLQCARWYHRMPSQSRSRTHAFTYQNILFRLDTPMWLTAPLKHIKEKEGSSKGSENVKDQCLPFESKMSEQPALNWYPLGLEEWTRK